jgi:hypothetical protein
MASGTTPSHHSLMASKCKCYLLTITKMPAERWTAIDHRDTEDTENGGETADERPLLNGEPFSSRSLCALCLCGSTPFDFRPGYPANL